MVKRALISVSDKTGIIEFAKQLNELGIEIISTGGTAKAISDEGIEVTNVSDVTGFPECLDGRVKTLHPKIHGGLLAIRDNKEHMEQIKQLGVETIDIVAINLYPFKETIMKEGVELEEAVENIDIGGPTMLRAAAKNYQDVVVIIDPSDYNTVINELKENNQVAIGTKFKLASKVFEHTSNYDTMISKYLRKQVSIMLEEEEEFPELLSLTYEKVQDLRYGENPHQKAVFYKEAGKNKGCLTEAEQLNGKELSFNNINDTNGALELLKEYEEPTIVAVKHANPCGVGSANSIYEAYMKAYEADPVSIFGGIVAANQEIDEKTAEEIVKIYVEIVIAPSYTQRALEIFSEKKNLRVLKLNDIKSKLSESAMDIKKVGGGILVQGINTKLLEKGKLDYVTKRKPTEEEMNDLLFAWKVVKHTKSNGIAIAKNKQSLGIGLGQVNRIWATEHAVNRSGSKVKGAVLASDAFFPFSDCVEVAAKAGITAIIQPGGSIKDQDSILACDKYGIAMIFTGMRHFKH